MPTPSKEEAEEVWNFIQSLPDKSEYGRNHDQFHKIWTRYKIEPEIIGEILGETSMDATKKIGEFMGYKAGKIDGSHIPEVVRNMDVISFLFSIVMSMGVQAFAWGSEYSRRWVLPDLLDEALEMQVGIDRLTSSDPDE